MQVGLLALPESAFIQDRKRELALPSLGDSRTPSNANDTDELRERLRRDEEYETRAAATLAPTRSSDVINDAERDVTASSRTFRRGVARDGATEQFREGRRAFRQALHEAREKGAAAGAQRPDGAKVPSDGKPGAETNTPARASQSGKPSAPGGVDPTRAGAPPDGGTPANSSAESSTVRGAPSVAGAAGLRVADRAAPAVPSAPGAQLMQNAAAARALPSGVVPGTRAATAAGAKTGILAQPGVSSTRGPVKSGALAAAKAGDAQSADRADRQANIERIVRVIRSQINGARSHTVMRLDPPELGSLRLQLDLRGSALSLRIEPTTELAHRLLTEDASRLRESLEASGVQLERIEVRPPTLAPESGEHGPGQHAGTQDEAFDGSAHADAEHPQEQGKDSHLASPVETPGCEDEAEPATESLVNVVA